MDKTQLLSLLASGEYRSGQDLADAIGVSRTAVWKQLNRLSELGVIVESVKGRGYRIPGGIDLLDAGRIQAGLSARSKTLLRRLEVLDSVDSTNAHAMREAQRGSAAGLVCTAEQQSAGRGRRGRQWVSPFAGNLYLSLVWEFSQGAAVLEGLSLAVGVGVASALTRCGLPPVQLKWPNDVLYGDKKLGGILLEMNGDAAGVCQVVVGVGLNVSMPRDAGGAIDQPWTDIESIVPSGHPGRNALLSALLNELLPLLAEFERDGFSRWRDEWQSLDALAGQQVILHTAERELAGTAMGVDERGALQLRTTTGMQNIYGGEISVRRIP